MPEEMIDLLSGVSLSDSSDRRELVEGDTEVVRVSHPLADIGGFDALMTHSTLSREAPIDLTNITMVALSDFVLHEECPVTESRLAIVKSMVGGFSDAAVVTVDLGNGKYGQLDGSTRITKALVLRRYLREVDESEVEVYLPSIVLTQEEYLGDDLWLGIWEEHFQNPREHLLDKEELNGHFLNGEKVRHKQTQFRFKIGADGKYFPLGQVQGEITMGLDKIIPGLPPEAYEEEALLELLAGA